MGKNKIFNSLLHLSGLSRNLDLVIELMGKAGYRVSLSQIRDWRRGQSARNYKPVPDFAFEVIFNYLFEVKKAKIDSFIETKNNQYEIPICTLIQKDILFTMITRTESIIMHRTESLSELNEDQKELIRLKEYIFETSLNKLEFQLLYAKIQKIRDSYHIVTD